MAMYRISYFVGIFNIVMPDSWLLHSILIRPDLCKKTFALIYLDLA
jgi:hypothetical protein